MRGRRKKLRFPIDEFKMNKGNVLSLYSNNEQKLIRDVLKILNKLKLQTEAIKKCNNEKELKEILQQKGVKKEEIDYYTTTLMLFKEKILNKAKSVER